MSKPQNSNIGKIIYGYCDGYFGGLDDKPKIIVNETETTICCQYVDFNKHTADTYLIADFESEHEKNAKIIQWQDDNIIEEDY